MTAPMPEEEPITFVPYTEELRKTQLGELLGLFTIVYDDPSVDDIVARLRSLSHSLL